MSTTGPKLGLPNVPVLEILKCDLFKSQDKKIANFSELL